MDIREGQTATNPKTGQKIIYKGGQWVNAGGSAPAAIGGRVGATVEKEMQDVRGRQREARAGMLASERLLSVANRYPGGIPKALVDDVSAKVGSTAPVVQDYKLFDVWNKRAAIAKAKALAPISNTDINLLIQSGANPTLTRSNNRKIIDADYSDLARTYYETALQQQWVAKYGSLSNPDPSGRTFGQALSAGLQKPTMKNILRPLSQRKAEMAQGNDRPRVIDFNDL